MTAEPETPETIAFRIVEEGPHIAKLLVLAVRKDGSSFSLDNGLTVDEAKTMAIHFHSWVDKCMGREEEKE
jgi:hypothetical protein